MKRTVASGGCAVKMRAISSTPAVPEPLSSAPGAPVLTDCDVVSKWPPTMYQSLGRLVPVSVAITLYDVTFGTPGTLKLCVVTVRPGIVWNCDTSQSRALALPG